MNVQKAAEVLCKYLEDATFAASVRANPTEATKAFGLTAEETETLFGGDETGSLPMKGFRAISKQLNEVPAALQQRLNLARGVHASAGGAIPVTGSLTDQAVY